MKLECGDDLVLSALPTRTSARGRFKVKEYYCPEHREYYARETLLERERTK